MMKNHFQLHGARGFSLIEVLLAAAIFSFGLLALASLQISVMRSSADSKSRSVALSIAKAKIEELRTYNTLAGYQAMSDATAAQITAGTTTVGGVVYTPTWAIARYVYNRDVDADGTLNETNDQQFQVTLTETGATPASPAGFVPNNEFKKITVSVSWSDETGAAQTVALEDAIAALAPSDSALIAAASTAPTVRRIPSIIRDPASDAMVIPIALGGGVNSAATNPKPQVVVGNSVVETQFDIYTYANLNGGTATAQARVETIMVGCTCDLNAVAEDAAFNKRPTYWDGFRYTVPLASTSAATSGPAASFVNLQSPRCNICCRDHHDRVGAEGATFSPRVVGKSSSNIVTAYHPHYENKTAVGEANALYKEACRLIRVDGIWRVASDLSNDYFGLLATGDGTTAATPIPDSTSVAGTPSVTGAVARYQKFVLGYLDGRYITPAPSDASAKATYNTIGNPVALADTAPYVLNNPSSISISLSNTTGKWLHSRGVYVDYIEQEVVDAIKLAKTDTACNATPALLKACVLKLLPFTSINLSEIADWSPIIGPPIKVDNAYYSTSKDVVDPVRGRVTSNASSATTSVITTSSRKSNSGLLDLAFDSISAVDDVPANDVQSFAVGGGAPPTTAGNGSFTVTIGGYTGTNTINVASYVTGAAGTESSGSLVSPFTVPVSFGSATTGLDSNGGLSVDVGGYNHAQTNAGQTMPVMTGCTSTQGLSAVLRSDQATNSPGTPQPYTGSVCRNYQVTNVTTTTPSPGTIGWSALAPYSPPDGRVNPYPGEVTRITFSGMISSTTPNTINVTLGLQSSTPQTASTCTYTCGQILGSAPSGTCRSNRPTTFNATSFPACP